MFLHNNVAVPVYKKLIINFKSLYYIYIILWIKFGQFNRGAVNIGI